MDNVGSSSATSGDPVALTSDKEDLLKGLPADKAEGIRAMKIKVKMVKAMTIKVNQEKEDERKGGGNIGRHCVKYSVGIVLESCGRHEQEVCNILYSSSSGNL